MKITILNQNFTLHPYGALFWQEKSCLFISDVHLGKVSHFRKFGAAVPKQAVHQNYVMLDEVIQTFQPFEICFLGDLFHSSLNKEWLLFENWVAKTPAKITLITGNHDIIAPEKFEALHIELHEEILTDGFLLAHHPEEKEGHYNFCGHIHPAVKLKGFGRQHLKLPCFYKTDKQLILPAFGEFTGTYVLTPQPEDEVFVLADQQVIKV
ncbi:ligase-associated DNA damage response endonuclease PdeM [Flavobacterium sp. ASW18X]|uniref:ligase-associated DNA damage response endonuclease PdeM n=1 Tax=Flavobacterium sp. ASW18X TaxID=2572595 RepID=UPI0010AE1F77|nr:ligase-associated DNA damage response endonuclease PdeM [Flavobacterium sp. ASW18X]TKD66471.1 ligase-associated DNA damage response endonuclease PdeM [Flavobacterium sp. ASW18X]